METLKRDPRKKREARLQVMRIGGGALEFSDLVMLMRRPELVQRLEVAAAEYERSCGREEEEDKEGSRGK